MPGGATPPTPADSLQSDDQLILDSEQLMASIYDSLVNCTTRDDDEGDDRGGEDRGRLPTASQLAKALTTGDDSQAVRRAAGAGTVLSSAAATIAPPPPRPLAPPGGGAAGLPAGGSGGRSSYRKDRDEDGIEAMEDIAPSTPLAAPNGDGREASAHGDRARQHCSCDTSDEMR